MHYGLIDLDRCSKIILGVLEEKVKLSMYIQFGLLCKFLGKSDLNFFHSDQDNEILDVSLSIKIS